MAALSRDPHGKWTVSSDARPFSSGGSACSEETTKIALGAPPRFAGRAARRDASRIAAWLASTASTSSSECSDARASTNRPSPAPRSMATERYEAARSVS